MSRIGKAPIELPDGVSVVVENGTSVLVSGPLGSNRFCFDGSVSVVNNDGVVTVVCNDCENEHARMMHGTVRSIINGMVLGVSKGYSKSLEINGVGFKASMKGADVLDLDLGYSHDILYKVPNGVKLMIDGSGTKIEVKGVDKQKVGQVAADIKRFYPVEPYKGKGVKIVGEFVRRKEGKKTA